MVVSLTGLIWFFADRADKESRQIKLSLTVQPPSSSIVVLGQDPAALDFTVTVHGPRGVIRQIEAETQGKPLKATYVLDENVGTGLQTFKAVNVLSQLPVIQERGLALSSPQPESFNLDIDRIVARPSIRIEPDFKSYVAECDKAGLGTCTVYLPQRLAADLDGGVLRIDVSSYVDANQPGAWISKPVKLRWAQQVPGAEYITFQPDSVNLRFRLTDTTEKRDIESVEVWWTVTRDMLRKYDLVPLEDTDFRPTITISGPKQRIDTLEKKDIKLSVEVLPEDEARAGQVILRRVSYRLPQGFQLVGPPPEVKFTLRPRTVSAAVGG